MRLTLRTLLAYLDNTLDSQDAEALKAKLAESGFATQLVQRIRDSLNNPMLAAPSPDAVGPVEDANAISEYLDSTLSAEQIAEIERACLESDPHLAEAAACHQILTMVLGKPANVTPELRKRIYELPDRQIEQIASGESYSSLSVPIEPMIVDPLTGRPISNADPAKDSRVWADDVPTADATMEPKSSTVEPVGVADSGVSDAPTRLRQMENADESLAPAATIGSADPAIAGAKTRSITNSEIYGGSIRPSRITPWLVSLAVAAVLLFALSQIFAPLMSGNKKVADVDSNDRIGDETEVQADQATPLIDIIAPTEEPPSVSNTPAESPPAQSPELGGEPIVETTAEEPPPVESPTDLESPSESSTASIDGAASDDGNVDPADRVPREPNREVGGDSAGDLVELPATDETAAENVVANATPLVSAATDLDLAEESKSEEPAVSSEPATIGKVTSNGALLAMLDGDKWTGLRKGAPVNTESVLVCAPTFHAEIVTSSEMTTTMIGPAEVQWQLNKDAIPMLSVNSGRLLLTPGEPQFKIDLIVADQPIQISFTDASHVAAIDVTYSRKPGFDPLDAENHTSVRTILAVQGTVTVSGAGNQTIEPGQKWVMVGNEEPTIVDIDPMPQWVQPPDPSDMTLDANARKGLLELLAEGDQPLEMALREATSFRRSEVAALAGQTLLVLGRGDVYFDGVGILNQPKQRAYWPDHFLALQQIVDRSDVSAAELRYSIQRMDAAHGDAIMRLLTGYSQQQLIDGGDEKLVEMLDSQSMAVRVLAIENLRMIKGTTNFYRADQENPVRRETQIKKWIARQRNGDIRWPE